MAYSFFSNKHGSSEVALEVKEAFSLKEALQIHASKGQGFNDLQIKFADLCNLELFNTKFTNCFIEANISRAHFYNIVFEKCILNLQDVNLSWLEGVKFIDCTFEISGFQRLNDADLSEVTFQNCDYFTMRSHKGVWVIGDDNKLHCDVSFFEELYKDIAKNQYLNLKPGSLVRFYNTDIDDNKITFISHKDYIVKSISNENLNESEAFIQSSGVKIHNLEVYSVQENKYKNVIIGNIENKDFYVDCEDAWNYTFPYKIIVS